MFKAWETKFQLSEEIKADSNIKTKEPVERKFGLIDVTRE